MPRRNRNRGIREETGHRLAVELSKDLRLHRSKPQSLDLEPTSYSVIGRLASIGNLGFRLSEAANPSLKVKPIEKSSATFIDGFWLQRILDSKGYEDPGKKDVLEEILASDDIDTSAAVSTLDVYTEDHFSIRAIPRANKCKIVVRVADTKSEFYRGYTLYGERHTIQDMYGINNGNRKPVIARALPYFAIELATADGSSFGAVREFADAMRTEIPPSILLAPIDVIDKETLV